jgi:hypothetical protein
MTTHRRLLISTTAIGVLAVSSYVVTSSRQAAAQSRGPEVIVANTPLPVEGAVSASQSGTWNVGVSGNVNVANIPQVRVMNAPTVQLAGGTSMDVTNPRDGHGLAIPLVTRESRAPLVRSEAFTFAFGAPSVTSVVLLSSPGSWSIIEHVGVEITSFASGQQMKARLLVKTCSDCPSAQFPIVLTSQAFGSTTQFVSSQLVRFYLAPGGNISIQLDRTFVSEHTAVHVSFSMNREPLEPF